MSPYKNVTHVPGCTYWLHTLWTDVVAEDAEFGLIVTNAAISPAGKKVHKACNWHNLKLAERETAANSNQVSVSSSCLILENARKSNQLDS